MPAARGPPSRPRVPGPFALVTPVLLLVGMLVLTGPGVTSLRSPGAAGIGSPVFSQSAPFTNASQFGSLTYHETSAHYLNCADASATVPASVNASTGRFSLAATAFANSRATCRPHDTRPLKLHGSYILGTFGLIGPAFQVPVTGGYNLSSSWTMNWNLTFNLHHTYPAGSMRGDLAGSGYVAVGFGYAPYGGPLNCIAYGAGGLPTCGGSASTSLTLLPWGYFIRANKSLTFGQANASQVLTLTGQHLQSGTSYELFAYVGVFLHTRMPGRFPAGTTVAWTIHLGTNYGSMTMNSWNVT
jgi:hypothetical protein